MPSLFVRCMLFFSSYFPLILIFGVFLWRSNIYWAGAVLLLGVFSLIITYLYMLRRWKKGGISQTRIIEVEKRDENVLSYIASYLVPFVTFPLATVEQIIALIVFIFVLMIVYVNSNMIYINPMFNFAGYHLYEITIDSDDVSRYLIARQPIRPQQTLYFVEIDGKSVYLEKKVKTI